MINCDPHTADIFKRCGQGDEVIMIGADGSETDLAVVREECPHIIVCEEGADEEMALNISGRFKADPFFRATSFILVSNSKKDDDAWERCLKAGVDDILFKPLSINEASARIHFCLKITRQHEEIGQLTARSKSAVTYLREYRKRLKGAGRALTKEKDLLHNSLKQIAMMVNDRDDRALEFVKLNDFFLNNSRSLIGVLTKVLSARGGVHREHSKKVAGISVFIATQMELPGKTVENIETAALLHELGQLLTPGLDQDRIEEVGQYSVSGADLLERFTGFEEVAKLVRHQHENCDGSGYPKGLKRKKIPMGSRIIAVADFFDTAVNKNGQSPELAFQHVHENIGVRFDPGVVHQLQRYHHRYAEQEKRGIYEVGVMELEPGMELAAGIFTTHGAMLLPEGMILSEASLNRVIDYNKIDPLEETVFIKG